jgi:hypothetical protein
MQMYAHEAWFRKDFSSTKRGWMTSFSFAPGVPE